MDNYLILLGYIGSLGVGVVLGLLGGGGSILTVPILVYLFGLSPTISTAYSLFIVGVTSLVGTYRYAQQKLIDYKVSFFFALPAFVGVFLARLLIVPNLPDEIFSLGGFLVTKDILIMGTFAVVMLAAAIPMIRSPKKKLRQGPADLGRMKFVAIGAEGLVVGMITGFVGAGGGFLIVPALVLLAGLPMKTAVGSSLLIISAKSLIGFSGDLMVAESLDWPFLGAVTVLSIGGIFIGSYASKYVSSERLKPAFGYFVLIMGCYIFIRQIL